MNLQPHRKDDSLLPSLYQGVLSRTLKSDPRPWNCTQGKSSLAQGVNEPGLGPTVGSDPESHEFRILRTLEFLIASKVAAQLRAEEQRKAEATRARIGILTDVHIYAMHMYAHVWRLHSMEEPDVIEGTTSSATFS